MKVILDIKDNKAAFVMELLNNLSFVKARPLSNETCMSLPLTNRNE
jgi:hypothetical protein